MGKSLRQANDYWQDQPDCWLFNTEREVLFNWIKRINPVRCLLLAFFYWLKRLPIVFVPINHTEQMRQLAKELLQRSDVAKSASTPPELDSVTCNDWFLAWLFSVKCYATRTNMKSHTIRELDAYYSALLWLYHWIPPCKRQYSRLPKWIQCRTPDSSCLYRLTRIRSVYTQIFATTSFFIL